MNFCKHLKYSFHFNLSSKNKRLKEPTKFDIQDTWFGGCNLCKQTDEKLIQLGDIHLYKKNNKDDSNCFEDEDHFFYHGIENPICGETINSEKNYFTPKKFVVIQIIIYLGLFLAKKLKNK